MSKTIVKTDKAPLPIGPYTQAVKANGFVFCSGQIPIDPKTSELSSGDVTEQTRLVLENLKAVLLEAGSSLAQVVKTTVFLKDMQHFPQMNAVYAEFFEEKPNP